MLPDARQVVLSECGHVPQVELPERANGLIREQVESGRSSPAAPSRAGLGASCAAPSLSGPPPPGGERRSDPTQRIGSAADGR